MFAGIHCQDIPREASAEFSPADPQAHLLADFAYSFSPLIEEISPDTVVIDVEGCALRFGSTYELAIAIARQAFKPKAAGGLERKVNVALAANPDAAIHAAKFCNGVTFTAAGEELTCLGDLPLTSLQCSLVNVSEDCAAEIFETLRLWGVRSFKEFAALPGAGVSERLGQDGLKLQQLAGGRTERHLKLRSLAPVFAAHLELDYPISELEPLSFIFARLLNQICASLDAYALATNTIRVELKLEKGGPHELKLNLPYPMRDQKVFLKLLLLDTEMNPPGSAVTAIAIACEPVKPRLLQTGLFIPLAPEPEKLELTLARLGKLVGVENVGSPELLDTHRPDAFNVKRFVLKEAKRVRRKKQTAVSNQLATDAGAVLAFRRYRPPLRALVQAQPGYPTEISAWDKSKSVYGKVLSVAGPWRRTGDWWRSDAWARDEWDVAVVTGAGEADTHVLYRIYRELGSGHWFVDGVYD